jgi:hypothetical protein
MLHSLQFPGTRFVLKILQYYWFNNVGFDGIKFNQIQLVALLIEVAYSVIYKNKFKINCNPA